MPATVKAKLLLGWMSRHEAITALNSCVFEEHLTDRKAVALWKEYRKRVLQLEPRVPGAPVELPLNPVEQASAIAHVQRLNCTDKAQFNPRVIKVHPAELLVKQFHMLTERSEEYAQGMQDERTRINTCLGVGLGFNGQLAFRRITKDRVDVDLPHPEFVVKVSQVGNQTNFQFQERDRYILVIESPGNRSVLWGGYHRTHAVLCHMGGDAAAVAPLFTVMTGIPEVVNFFARPSFEREVVLGDRPALLRDFLDENLFIRVDLRRRRARGRIEEVRPGKFRWRIDLVNDDS